MLVNPRPAGVWQVTRPDGGGGTNTTETELITAANPNSAKRLTKQ